MNDVTKLVVFISAAPSERRPFSPSTPFLNKDTMFGATKDFLGKPAPPGYIAGLGRGYASTTQDPVFAHNLMKFDFLIAGHVCIELIDHFSLCVPLVRLGPDSATGFTTRSDIGPAREGPTEA